MGGTGKERLPVPCASLAPPPSPSPVKGEGIEEVKSLPEIALEIGDPTTDLLTLQDDDSIARWSGKHFWRHDQITKLVTR